MSREALDDGGVNASQRNATQAEPPDRIAGKIFVDCRPPRSASFRLSGAAICSGPFAEGSAQIYGVSAATIFAALGQLC